MQNESQNIHDISLKPPLILTESLSDYYSDKRAWQGIPGIERTPQGRIFATWYSGGKTEEAGNYVVLVKSDDDGASWEEPFLVVAPSNECVRQFDPVLWIDPLGRLWLFWSQSYAFYNGRIGVWYSRCDEPDKSAMHWTTPQRIGNGIMMNKPTITTTGKWLLPIALWGLAGILRLPELADECKANVFQSTDSGESWERLGGVDAPCRSFDEHMLIEKQDGTLWMLIRTKYGIAESFSSDEGNTWSQANATSIDGPDSRFHIRRLKSGRLLLINHYKYTGRSHLTARLSDDDGKSWFGELLLDERCKVSYPDAVENDDGSIYVIYDYNRYSDREILMAKFTEENIINPANTAGLELTIPVNKATGILDNKDHVLP